MSQRTEKPRLFLRSVAGPETCKTRTAAERSYKAHPLTQELINFCGLHSPDENSDATTVGPKPQPTANLPCPAAFPAGRNQPNPKATTRRPKKRPKNDQKRPQNDHKTTKNEHKTTKPVDLWSFCGRFVVVFWSFFGRFWSIFGRFWSFFGRSLVDFGSFFGRFWVAILTGFSFETIEWETDLLQLLVLTCRRRNTGKNQYW